MIMLLKIALVLFLAWMVFSLVAVGTFRLCGKFARMLDRTPNRIIIPACFLTPVLIAGSLILLSQL